MAAKDQLLESKIFEMRDSIESTLLGQPAAVLPKCDNLPRERYFGCPDTGTIVIKISMWKFLGGKFFIYVYQFLIYLQHLPTNVLFLPSFPSRLIFSFLCF